MSKPRHVILRLAAPRLSPLRIVTSRLAFVPVLVVLASGSVRANDADWLSCEETPDATRAVEKAPDSTGDAASSVEVRTFLRELSARSQTIDSLRVRFRQEKRLRILRRPRVSEGELLYANGRLLMTTRDPDGAIESQLHVEDGELRLYYPGLELVEVLPARADAGAAGSAAGSGLMLPLVDGRWERLLESYRVEMRTARVRLRADGSLESTGSLESSPSPDAAAPPEGGPSRENSSESGEASPEPEEREDRKVGEGRVVPQKSGGEESGDASEIDAVVLLLTPKDEASKVQMVRATFVEFRARELLEQDRAGNRMRMEILEWTTGVRVADAALRLVVPAGTRVVRLAP